ncbi:MAG: FlgD immunoglobulin-like domain containing protein [Candidatus Krumholzibacteria bacterium]|nr:FlgD immunoglobulin-like domain containing protein [Candidatus Krumholzibacteria bacterium]
MRYGGSGFLRAALGSAVISAFFTPVSGEDGPAGAGPPAWNRAHVLAVDEVGDVPAGFEGADLLAFYFDEGAGELRLRVSMVMMRDPAGGTDLFLRDAPSIAVLIDYRDGGLRRLPAPIEGEASISWDEAIVIEAPAGGTDPAARPFSAAVAVPRISRATLDRGAECIEATMSISPSFAEAARAATVTAAGGERARTPVSFEIVSVSRGRIVDRIETSTLRPLSPGANCAFVHHGNQGLAYSDVFRGRWDDPEGSGFDEALQAHETTQVPGNFHLCGPLQTSAEWDANNGDPVDFNAWLAAGVSAGWAGMVTSAWGQHMMPFVRNEMNDWAVNIQTQMTDYRYGYYPRVAWVPERVWLDPFVYPNAGVIDNLVDNWISHGVWAVILDDDVHCQGYDNHQVHQFSGSALKVLPRDRSFTGNIVGGNGAAALQTLADLSGSGLGDYRIVCYAEDWEAAAEMGSWATSTPNAKETYDWFIGKCSAESAWISVWKVADAVTNPDFQGSASFNVTCGTYSEIGGTGGYGGGNNGWYTHWAGYVPYATGGDGSGICDPGRGGSCKDHGTIWNDAYNALMAAPSNNISEAGWYTMMMNLHETGWHDYLGGPISGWQLRYSGHIKNANIYAEASRWANGEYASATGAYLADIDGDGWGELVMHNDRVFAVFESIGARATNVFAKGPGYAHSIVGVDVAYWAGTEGDYNDVNHVGLLSDVGPNYQHSLYQMTVVQGSGATVEARFTHENLKKTVKLTLGTPYLDIIYDTGQSAQYVKNGYSPGLVDLLWNARMDRVWAGDAAYFGQRNPNNGATAAIVVGSAGAGHNFELSGRIMKGDEIYGSGVFEVLFYAGTTSEPVEGEIAELRALAGLSDTIGPMPREAVYFPGTDKLRISFNQVTQHDTAVPTGVSIDDDGDGIADLTLSPVTSVVETQDGFELTLQLSPADAASLESLATGSLELLLAASSFFDMASNGNRAVTGADDIPVSYGPATMITIDGYIDVAEWDRCRMAVADSIDSEWTSANEIDALYVTWDADYLYIALDGIVSGNSWLIYLDTDPGGPEGETDLTAIDIWERGAVFTAAGFRADFQYGCYQHQGIYDSDSFWRLISPTTAADLSDSILSAFDSNHLYGGLGGSELAVPWEVLYGMGPGAVAPGASISIVASLCWDPEPDGVLGGDSAPSNTAASLPAIDNVYTFAVDADADGIPDEADDTTPPGLIEARRTASSDSLVDVLFSEPVDPADAQDTSNWEVYRTDAQTTLVDVLSASVQGDGRTVRLALAHAIAYGWTCAAHGIADLSCNANVMLPGSAVMIRGAAVTGDDPSTPYAARLYQNFPNPFNPATVVRFDAPGRAGSGTARVVLAVYDVQGRLVRTLVDRAMPAGPAEAVWDGTNAEGAAVSSGIYFVRMDSAGQRLTRKMVLLR